MLANLSHHSATLQGHTTELHSVNIQESTISIGKGMLWLRRGRANADGKQIFVSLYNLSGQRLKTKESNVPEFWFKH